MASYQVVCSVLRPRAPTQLCQIPDFQDKVHQHISTVLHDVHLNSNGSEDTLDHGSPINPAGADNHVLCAVISKTKASFSGEDNFQSRVKLPYFWCNFCPYSTESRPSLLQHVATQHCFRCRHCAFVAFSRSQVVQHSLRQHPAFQKQARQQKLKGCQLLRKAFQDNFSPEPVSERRSGSKDTAVGKSTCGAGPSKQEESHRLWCVDQEEASHVQMDDNSSSTDSSDDNCLPDRERQLALSHTNSINSACTSRGDDCRLVIKTESLSENIVSSSNMDVDTGVDARPSIFSEPGQTNTDWESASDRETLQMTYDTDTGEPQVVIKQEAEDEDEFSFVVQESRYGDRRDPIPVLDSVQSSVSHLGQDAGYSAHASCHPEGDSVTVKTEPATEDDFNFQHSESNPVHVQEDRSHPDSQAESQSSPPLSSIHVENLQRQFEESVRQISFSLNGTDHFRQSLGSARTVATEHVSHSADHLPRSRSEGNRDDHVSNVSRKVVDNFLLDSPADSETDERTTLLRQLLTKAGRREAEHTDGNQTSPADVHWLSSDDSSVRPVSFATERDSIFSSHNHSGKEPSESCQSYSAVQPASLTRNPGLDVEVPIKQEPVDDIEYMHTFTHIERSGEGVAIEHVETFLPGKTSGTRELAEESDLSLVDILKRSQRQMETSQRPKSGKCGHAVQADMEDMTQPSSSSCTGQVTLSPAEKLKSLSNMTLRDILTMKIPLVPGAEEETASNIVEMTEVSLGSDDFGQVAWECGFCEFAASEKEKVMVHRQRWHSDLMAHSGMSGFHGMGGNNGSHDGERLQGERGHYSGLSYHGGLLPHQGSFPGSAHKPDNATISRTKFPKRYKDYDYQYLSSASPLSVESSTNSEAEADDPDDRNYIPPPYLLDKTVSSGSDSESVGANKTRSGFLRKPRHQGVKRKCKEQGKTKKPPATEAASVRGEVKHVSGSNVGIGFYNPTYIYKCQFCDCTPSTLQRLKRHIRFSPDLDRKHLLIAEMVSYPNSVLLVCPKDSCCFVSVSEKAFLEHVLSCQGTILDVSRESAKAHIFQAYERAVNCRKEAGSLSCPVSGCSFSAPSSDHMQNHLLSHVDRFHNSQMVLCHSVSSAMTKLCSVHPSSEGYVCYLCYGWFASIKSVFTHAREKHEGKMRGVFHLNVSVSGTGKPQVKFHVGLTCLKCQQEISNQDEWYQHECPADSQKQETSDFQLECHVTSLDEWPWMMTRTGQDTVDKDVYENSRQNQLPLVRSILMDKVGIVSDRKNLTDRGSSASPSCVSKSGSMNQIRDEVSSELQDLRRGQKVARSASTAKASSADCWRKSRDRDQMPLTMCDVCQNAVPETQLKQHICFVEIVSAAGKSTECESSLRHTDSYCEEGSKLVEGEQLKSSAGLARTVSGSVKRSYPLLTQSLHSSQIHGSSTISHAKTKGRMSQDCSGSPASSSRGASSLRSLLVGLPAGDRDAWDRVVKRSRVTSSILKETLLGHGEAASTPPTVPAAQTHGSASSQVSPQHAPSASSSNVTMTSAPPPVGKKDSRSTTDSHQRAGEDTHSGMTETSDMVNWLQQQGSQMMRVLGNAMDKEDDEL